MNKKKLTFTQKKLAGLNWTAMIFFCLFFFSTPLRSLGLSVFNPINSALFSKYELLRGGSILQTVPLSTEISLILGFSFIWVKCIGSSSPRREKQFDGGGK